LPHRRGSRSGRGSGRLWEKAKGSRIELIAYSDSERSLQGYRSAIAQWIAVSGRAARCTLAEQDDLLWQTAWTRYLRPEPLGDSFVLQPLTDGTPAPRGRAVVHFEPEMAFGVGSHPTTRLAARAVERECRRRVGCRLLDVGTGTGVLAMIGALSGAARVVGLDVDPVSVRAAAHNARLNGLDHCEFSGTPVAELTGVFDIVVANIELPSLLAIADGLVRRTHHGGRLLVTGFLSECREQVEGAVSALGLSVVGVEHEAHWALLGFHRE
jgi:ribosomal protein L11 methyltransferase